MGVLAKRRQIRGDHGQAEGLGLVEHQAVGLVAERRQDRVVGLESAEVRRVEGADKPHVESSGEILNRYPIVGGVGLPEHLKGPVAAGGAHGVQNDLQALVGIDATPGDEALTAEDLLEHCQGKLSRFKQPTGVAFIESIPRNPAGKILKRELREQFPGPAPD